MSPVKVTRLSDSLKRKITTLKEKGYKPTAIRKVIVAEEDTILTTKAIRLYLNRRKLEEIQGYPSPKRRPQPEKRKLDQEHLDFINATMQGDDETSAGEIQTKLLDRFGMSVSLSTIRRAHRQLGWVCTAAKYGQLVRDINQEKRKEFCRRMIASKETFSDVIFTDESTVKMQTQIRRCFRLRGYRQRVKGVPKHPYQVHVWAGISRRGATTIAVFTGRMDSQVYQDILRDNLLPFARDVYSDGFCLYQDNDPKHKSKSTLKWLQENGVEVMDAPPESPDLNPIELIWADLKYQLRRNIKPRTKEQLVEGILNYWEKLTPAKLKRYIDHLYKVIPQVILAEGKASGY